ncbi:YceI-like domain-containing protein [Ulvibacter sp. MAR_2010_11]|uniref:YceI family protein n=1 Tax=Ulvibacter sp. MAR_2010_11 TaxID=1250229 RepID=UPI000C2BB11B|nr:YceI family protein [Ulvibacter sp. MAR_2010_11]PKA84157.1 YceI-like domain-containing protein [Ulvibacter sp. MAR_2010_11]
MKKHISSIIFAIFTVAFLNAQENITLNSSKSELKWSCDYTFYFGGHNGTISFKEGHLIKTKDVLTGGSFIIDMHSIVNLDIEKEEGKKDLVEHLKNEDFFDVKLYPTAKLVITDVFYHDSTHLEIKADLTIKGKTNPIKFQAEVNYEKLQMTTRFKINRTLWGVIYSSSLMDNSISDGIGFEADLRFTINSK